MLAIRCFWAASILSLVCFAARLDAGVPTDHIRETTDDVLQVLNDPQFRPETAKSERRARLRQIIYPSFDFAEMARRSLGPAWQRINSQEQEEFIGLFTQLLEESYVSNIESYNGEKILYGREIVDGNFAEVDTKIVSNKGEEFAVNYKLQELNGDWKAYDIIVENVSIVNNYRSQFGRILTKRSFPELLDTIREKVKSLQ